METVAVVGEPAAIGAAGEARLTAMVCAGSDDCAEESEPDIMTQPDAEPLGAAVGSMSVPTMNFASTSPKRSD